MKKFYDTLFGIFSVALVYVIIKIALSILGIVKFNFLVVIELVVVLGALTLLNIKINEIIQAENKTEDYDVKFKITKVDPIEEVNKSDDIAVRDYDFRPTYPTGSTPDQIIGFPNFYEPNEVVNIFSDCQLKRADWEELYRYTRALDFTNYAIDYFKQINSIKNFIMQKVPDEYREKVAFDFTKYVEERNYKVLKNALDAEESHLFELKTRRGRLNSIARFEDNYYLYREYLSRGNLDFLNEGIASLKDRYHLDQDEIVEGDVQ